MKAYQVIGGQYEHIWYGESNSLRGAQVIARKNKELWDNFQGWHTPHIYRAEDCEEINTKSGTKRIPKTYDTPCGFCVAESVYK